MTDENPFDVSMIQCDMMLIPTFDMFADTCFATLYVDGSIFSITNQASFFSNHSQNGQFVQAPVSAFPQMAQSWFNHFFNWGSFLALLSLSV